MSSDADVCADGGGLGYEDLLAEVVALRAENDRLRGLLGLGERDGDGHARTGAPAPPAPIRPTRPVTVRPLRAGSGR